jgi:hypothetical protein
MSSAYQKNSISTKGAEIGTLSQITHANAKSLSEEFLGNDISTTVIGSILTTRARNQILHFIVGNSFMKTSLS